jgi:thiosulfate dehydrogenase
MNGTAPPADSTEMTALVTYMFWLASGAPTGVKLPGQGFLSLARPPKTPDINRGAEVFKDNCALCHGADGHGTKLNGTYAFPPLWGKDSYNWGAGMHRINTAAGFIKANMPYGRGGTLTDQQAWDVALYMNSQDRPEDPRFEGGTAQTRDAYHDENCLYGRTPAELATWVEQKEQADAARKAAEQKTGEGTNPQRGLSPATAH